MDLSGKNVIYIGGFGGIGQKCIRELLTKGVQNLIIFDLKENAEILEELQKCFPASTISFIQLDITQKSNIEEAYKAAAQLIGHFDVVINGCGLMNDAHVELTIQINLLGVIQSTLTAMKYMDKSAGGRGGLIVNIASVAGLEPSGMFAVYSAAKCGVTAFTRALANPLHYAHFGIGFITICPGLTETALLEDLHGKETFKHCLPMTERFAKLKTQSADVCSQNMVKTIESAKNGSVWLLDLGAMKEVQMPVMWTPTMAE